MEKNMKIARAHRALAFLYGLCALVFGIYVLFDGVSPMFLSTSALLVLLVVLHIAVGRGARARKPWARIASIVIGVLMLLGFPIGTLIGLYLIVNAVPRWAPLNASFEA